MPPHPSRWLQNGRPTKTVFIIVTLLRMDVQYGNGANINIRAKRSKHTHARNREIEDRGARRPNKVRLLSFVLRGRVMGDDSR